MKKMRFIYLLLVTLSTLLITGCSFDDDGDDNCYYQGYASISDVAGPETVAVGEPAVFDIDFVILSDCGSFIRFDTYGSGTGEYTSVSPAVAYTGCQCAEIARTETEQFTFQVDEAGEYELRFPTSNTTYITQTITVTE